MRETPYEFVHVGNRWINMALVTDVRDGGDRIFIFLAAPMLGKAEHTVTGGRRVVLKEPGEVESFRTWMTLHD